VSRSQVSSGQLPTAIAGKGGRGAGVRRAVPVAQGAALRSYQGVGRPLPTTSSLACWRGRMHCLQPL